MVPKGWYLKSLGEIAEINPRKPDRPNDGLVSFIPMDAVSESATVLRLEDRCYEDVEKGFTSFKDRDVLVAKITPCFENGKGAIVEGLTNGIGFGSTEFHVLRATPDASPSFIYYVTNTEQFRIKGEANMQGSAGQKRVTTDYLKILKILVPPISEQRKIAKILSTWDKAIATTERLLANKQQQKKALMQRLLTGKQRFAGFEGEWKTFTLKSVSEVYVSPVDKKALPDEHTVQLCNYTDVYYNSRIFANHKFMQATATQRECERFKINKGDVLITKDSETPTDIAKAAYIAEELDNVLCGYHLAIIRAKDELVDGEFLSYLFQLPHTQYHFFTLATGATRFGLSVGAIENATFYVPHITEQRQIATFLRTIDKELSKMLSSLDNLKLQKKALMQQLLTGKRRVKVDEAAA